MPKFGKSSIRRDRKRAFGARLCEHLKRLGWSVPRGAKVARVHQDRMFRYTLGLTLPHRQTLVRLAEAIGVELADLAPWEN